MIAGFANARRKGKWLGRPPVPDDLYEKAKELRRQGLYFRKIGRELGADQGTIRKRMKLGNKPPVLANNYIFIVWTLGGGKGLRVVWKACSDDFFIPIKASNSGGTVISISDVFSKGGSKYGIEKFRLGNLSGEYYVESVALYPKAVFSIIHLTRKISS